MFSGFSKIQLYAFDMDGTLYPDVTPLVTSLWQRHIEYVRERHPALDQIHFQQNTYRTLVRDHGTMHHAAVEKYGLDRDHYLDTVYDIDVSGFQADPCVPGLIEGLPGQKIVFTNSTAAFAGRLLAHLGHAPQIPVIAVEQMGYWGKPHLSAYQALLNYDSGLRPDEICLIEDTAVNLAPAKALGLKTVFLHGRGGAPRQGPDTDVSCVDVVEFLHRAQPLIPGPVRARKLTI